MQKNNYSNVNDNITWYFNKIKNFKILTREEEITLFKKYKNGKIDAQKQIIESNLELVVSIAKKYVNENNFLKLDDLIQEGNFGLMKAIESYDYTKGYKFSTYATYWIKSYIGRVAKYNTPPIKLPYNYYEKYLKLNKVIENAKNILNRELTINEIANLTGYSISDVNKFIIDNYSLFRLNNLMSKEEKKEYVDLIPSSIPLPNELILQKNLCGDIWHLLNNCNLTNTEITILKLRYGLIDGNELSYTKIGEILNIHKKIVRDIELRALKNIRSSSLTLNIIDYLGDKDRALNNLNYFRKKNYNIPINKSEEIEEHNLTKKELKIKELIYQMLYCYTLEQREFILRNLTREQYKLMNDVLFNKNVVELNKEEFDEVIKYIYPKINKLIKRLEKMDIIINEKPIKIIKIESANKKI